MFIIGERQGPASVYFGFDKYANLEYAKQFLSIGRNVVVRHRKYINAYQYKNWRVAKKNMKRIARKAYKLAKKEQTHYTPGSEIKKTINEGLFVGRIYWSTK